MYIMTLDVKATHVKNPECPMRIARLPSGGWMCVDCGLSIIHKCLNTDRDSQLTKTTLRFGLDDPEGCLLDMIEEELADIDRPAPRCSGDGARRKLARRTGVHFPPPPEPPPVPPDANEGTYLIETDTWLKTLGRADETEKEPDDD